MNVGGDGDRPEPARRRRLGEHSRSALWLVVGLVAGALAAHPLEQSFERVRWHAAHGLDGSPDCRDTGWYDEVQPQQATAFRQYEQRGERPQIFTADNTHDRDPNTAWIAPFSATAEENYIRWTLPRQRQVALICLRSGWTRDYTTLAGNLRPKDVVVRGCREGDISLQIPDRVDLTAQTLVGDWKGYDALTVECTADEIELLVTSAHQAYDGSQLVAISDVRFYTGFQVLGD